MIMDIEDIHILQDNGVKTLTMLAVLVYLSEDRRIDDVCKNAGIGRRGFERMMDVHPDLIEKHEDIEANKSMRGGAPFTLMIKRSRYCNRLIDWD